MLRQYQKDCLAAFQKQSLEGGKDLYIMPTGAGKSHVIAAIAEQLKDKDILIIVPRRELVRQNKEKINNQNIRCMTINLAYRRNERADILIIDECHLIPRWDGMYQSLIATAKKVIGFTATPFRLDTGHLVPNIFDDVVYDLERDGLVSAGYLTQRQFIPIPPDHIINVRNNSFKSLKKLSDDMCPHTAKCLDHFKNNRVKDYGTLIFGCDLTHCAEIQKCLDDNSPILSSKTSKRERLEIIDKFTKGEISTLINCEILTTGFDYPALNNIVILRPTDSYSLYEQILGRGDRVHESKSKSYIFDYTINSFNFDTVVKKSNPIKHCIFCYELTDYRGSKCEHCNSTLVKGEAPAKECKTCKFLNHVRAVYCKDCGEFIRKNVYMFEFNSLSRDGSYIVFKKHEKHVRLPTTDAAAARKAIKIVKKMGGSTIFYKIDHSTQKPKIIEVR